jgi:trigger factor
VKVALTEKDTLVRQLDIEIPADKVTSEMNEKFADFRKKADIKGFRRGKVPMTMIKSLYSEEVRAMVADELVKSTLSDAMREKDLRVAATPKLVKLDFNEAGDLVYSAEVEVFPPMEPVTFDGLSVEKAKSEVADKDVNEIAEFYRQRFSDLRPVNREIQVNDMVTVDLQKLDDPKGIMTQDTFEGVEIDLAKEMTVKEFREGLPGLKAGESKEIKVSYADDYPDERFKGASISYTATVKEVKERILPEFDDALAKRSGQAETALELKLKIRKELQQERDDVQKNRLRGEVIAQLCEKNPIPIPEGLIEEYLESMFEDYKKKFEKVDEKEFKTEYRENAVNSLRWNLLYHRLAEQEKIEVSPEDTENWINSFAQANGIPAEQAKQALAKSGRGNSVRESILEQKTLDFLLEKAKVTEK